MTGSDRLAEIAARAEDPLLREIEERAEYLMRAGVGTDAYHDGVWMWQLLAEVRRLSEAVERQDAALRYISSPTMGLPPGRDALEYAEQDATESAVRLALAACIRTARGAIEGKS